MHCVHDGLQSSVVCQKDMFRVQEVPTATINVGSPLNALVLDASLVQGQAKMK